MTPLADPARGFPGPFRELAQALAILAFVSWALGLYALACAYLFGA